MNRCISLKLTLFLFLFFFLAGSSWTMQSVVISGEITDTSGTPIRADVTIVEGRSNVRSWSVQSDFIGKFSFHSSDGTPLTIVAKANGYLSAEHSLVVGTIPLTLQFKLSLPGGVSGRVVDTAGKGIAGASLAIRYLDDLRSIQYSQEIADVATDDFGYFTLRSVAGGRPFVIDVAALKFPVISSSAMILNDQSLTGIVITVEDAGQHVRGRVVDARGQPVANISVELKSLPMGHQRETGTSPLQLLQANRSEVTGFDGSFDFQGLPQGQVALRVTACKRTVEIIRVGDTVPFTTITLPCVRRP